MSLRLAGMMLLGLGIASTAAPAAVIDFGPVSMSVSSGESDVLRDFVTEYEVIQNPSEVPYGWPSGPGTTLIFGWASSGDWHADFEIMVDDSVAIFEAVEFQSLLAVPQDFDIAFSRPVLSGLPGPTTMLGSASGSIGDAETPSVPAGDGAILSDTLADDPFYRALIDDVSVRTLLDPSYEFVAPPFLTNPFDGGDFVDEPAGAVTTEIRIEHNWRLSPGDRVTFTTSFRVVPEPTTLLLLLGMAPLALRRRRR